MLFLTRCVMPEIHPTGCRSWRQQALLACLVQPPTNFRMHKVADTAPLLHDTATAIIDCFN